MEQKRKKTWYVVAGLIIAGLIAVLWVGYAGTQKLLRELDSRDSRVQVRAARALVERGVLEDSLPAQPEPRRAHAAIALGLVGTDAAMQQLVTLIKDPEDLPQRAAAKTLGRLGAKSITYLLPVLKEGDARGKAAAVSAFAIIGQPAVPALTKALSDADRREQAAIALGEIGGAGRRPLLRAATGKDQDLRAIAIQVLGEVRDRRGVPAAISAVAQEKLRRTAIIALGLMADRRATATIIPYLKDPLLHIDAATSLGQIGDPAAVPALLAELREPERQFRDRAVWALQRIGRGGAPVLAAALQVGTDAGATVHVRRAAAEGLRWTHTPEAIPALTGALRDPDTSVRAAAARALGWRGNATAVAALLGALSDRNWQAAAAAAAALADVGAPAVEPLIAMFGNPDVTKRMLASDALAAMDDAPVPRLIQVTEAAASPAAEWAVITLGKIGDPAAVARLRAIAASGSGLAKWAAGEALRKFGGQATSARG